MKRKEKLSKEFAVSCFPEAQNDFLIDWKDAQAIWIAGFEKAREMSIINLRAHSKEVQNLMMISSASTLLKAAENLESLGEEEIEC